MKIILTTFLFFCLALTTILAQVVRNISAPNSSDVSTHSVDDFDVNSDGIILNNSAIDGIAQLGAKAVDAHPNITAGSEASLILFQVTGTSGSDLDGTIEVFGGEAGLIIAIPLGLAIINPASPPNTSIVPSKSLPLVPVTWNRIRDASLPAVILGWASTALAPNWAMPSIALLFKIMPSELTSKSSTEWVDTSLELGADIFLTT